MAAPGTGLDLILSETTGGSLVLELVGELDIVGAVEFEAALRDLRDDLYVNMILDLSGLTFIDSSGLRAVLSAHRTARARSFDLRIVPGPPPVQRVFERSDADIFLTWME